MGGSIAAAATPIAVWSQRDCDTVADEEGVIGATYPFAMGSSDCPQSPAYHDLPPQRLLLNLADATKGGARRSPLA
jgi:hypothetical protein